MTALSLAQAHPRLDITLVESPDVATVGVGEATLNTIQGFLVPNGIHEDELFGRCDASIKLGIRYAGWSDRAYWHPFGEVLHPPEFVNRWVGVRALEGAAAPPFDEVGGLGTWDLAADGLAPRTVDDPEYVSRTVEYGYHLDAARFAALLTERATAAGVGHVLDHVEGVERGPAGIAAVVLRDQGRLDADLYVDCTGFGSLLLGGALDEPFDSYARWLPNDRAVAVHRARDADAPVEPFVTATALGNGWAWNIPLWGRDGTGYVYSSAFCDPADAEAELLAHLGADAELSNLGHLEMRVGARRRVWVENCVAVGLSGGFIEPLESTGLAMIDIAQAELAARLAGGGYEPTDRDDVNGIFTELYEGIRDFIALHFVTAARADTAYWKTCTTDASMVPDRVAEILERWDQGLAPHAAPGPFHPSSWIYILDGNGRWPSARAATKAWVSRQDEIDAALRHAVRRAAAPKVPTMAEYLGEARRRWDSGERSPGPTPEVVRRWTELASEGRAAPR